MNIVTKVFLVLTLVFSIAVAVVVLLMAGRAQDYKTALTNEQVARLGAMAALTKETGNSQRLEGELADAKKSATEREKDLQGKYDRVSSDLVSTKAALDTAQAQLTETTTSLARAQATIKSQTEQLTTKDQELSASRPQLTEALRRAEEVNRTNNDLTNRLTLAEKTIRMLQEKLATQTSAPTTAPAGGAGAAESPAVASMSAGAPTSVQINGKVNRVQTSAGRTYLTLSLGTRDGVQAGTRLTIYRNNQFVGDVKVVRADVDQSVAEVTMLKPGLMVQANDLVISGGGL